MCCREIPLEVGSEVISAVVKSKVSVLAGPDSIMMSFEINSLFFERLFLGI